MSVRNYVVNEDGGIERVANKQVTNAFQGLFSTVFVGKKSVKLVQVLFTRDSKKSPYQLCDHFTYSFRVDKETGSFNQEDVNQYIKDQKTITSTNSSNPTRQFQLTPEQVEIVWDDLFES